MMSENSKIEWCDHTFNPWWGCMKVSEGCRNCYAETLDNRWKGGHWGPGSSRRAMSEDYWRQPVKWNVAAKKAGVKAKVFCASMADVFEGHPDTLIHLERLFRLIFETPHLIWQLLTKRPETAIRLIRSMCGNQMPDNIWIGASVENQKAADERIPLLLEIPASTRFLSCEPLLGPVDLSYWIKFVTVSLPSWKIADDNPSHFVQTKPAISWVICGGESGPHARPMHPGWVTSLRDQCHASKVAFFFKQWGEYGYDEYMSIHKMGKKKSGRLLHGVEHNEFPNP